MSEVPAVEVDAVTEKKYKDSLYTAVGCILLVLLQLKAFSISFLHRYTEFLALRWKELPHYSKNYSQ